MSVPRNEVTLQPLRTNVEILLIPAKLFRVTTRFRALPVTLGIVPTVQALGFGFGGKKTEETTVQREPSQEEILITKADDLYSKNEIHQLYDMLVVHKNCQNDELLWRLARATCDKGKMAENQEEKKKLMYEAYEYIQKALLLNDENFASHKWHGILLDYVGEYEGTKQRLSNAYQVKDEFLKAIELNPKDATTVHALGYWCFLFAELPWYQRKVAAVIFTTPPSSSYDEALKYFRQAEEMDPNFYSMNLLYLGKCYLRLNDKKKALVYLTRARDYHVKTEDDKQAHKEAVELLKGLGVKEGE